MLGGRVPAVLYWPAFCKFITPASDICSSFKLAITPDLLTKAGEKRSKKKKKARHKQKKEEKPPNFVGEII